MKKALFLTAYNRPDYLAETLASWSEVRGQDDWHFVAMIEPSPVQSQILKQFYDFLGRYSSWGSAELVLNPTRYGVLHHPWVGYERLFKDQDFDFVVRAEDDLLVSQDVLEYQSWAAETYESDPAVGLVSSFAADNRATDEVHRVLGLGSPLILGTWRDRWINVIGPTWDHDYSTNEGSHMDRSGWDWNLNLRVLPARGLHAILPNRAKTFHMGVYGEHSNPEIYYVQEPFDSHVPPQQYREVSQ